MDILNSIGTAFQHGGGWMYAILLMQIVSLSIIAERIITLYAKRQPTQKALAKQFEKAIRRGDLEAVIEQAKTLESTQPLARAILAGAQSAQNLGGKDEIQAKMDEVLLEENSILEKRTGFLSMTGNVATLLGLLGTIVGMIHSFAAVAEKSAVEKSTLISAGISEAMNCTAYGLVVAIPALVLYAVLVNRSSVLAEDLNQAALKVFNWLSFNYESVPARPARQRVRSDEVSAN